MLNLIKSLVIGNLLFINLSCNINKQHLSPRPFFSSIDKVELHYDRSLDFLMITAVIVGKLELGMESRYAIQKLRSIGEQH